MLKLELLEKRLLLDAGSLAGDGLLSQEDVTVVVASGTAVDELPDLIALADEGQGWMHGWSIDNSEQPGHKLLRLTTAVGNIGEGALEIRGGQALPNGNQEVYQRIFDSVGGFHDVLAGEFVYHPEHGHTHFEGLAQYHLRAVTAGNGVGEIIASGDKTSFCLLDIAEIDPLADGKVYEDCTPEQQGISPGWADVYDQSLPDQWIDITGVAAGTYWLEVVIDPDDNLVESDETNNSERILIELIEGGGADRFEENDDFQSATDLGLVGFVNEPELSIDSVNDDDYYLFTALEDGPIDVSVYFVHGLGDVDLEVFDDDQNLINDSASTSNEENVVITAMAGQTYFVRVFGYSGATNPDYDLVIGGQGSAIEPDFYEPNDSFAGATLLGTLLDFNTSDLSIHTSDNDDYYQFTAALTGDVSISLSFTHELGDVDLGVYSQTLTLIEDSNSTDDSENIVISAVAGETYYVRVYGYGGDTNPEYELTIDGPEIPADFFEPNDNFSAVSHLGTLGYFSNNSLSIHAPDNEDYFHFTAASTGNVSITLAFIHSLGDVDLAVYADDEELLDSSTSSSDAESVVISAVAGESYYVRVYGYFGATNSQYELVIDGPVSSGDFDEDGDVDGRDFLAWQRGQSPDPLSPTDLASWQTNYGQPGGNEMLSALSVASSTTTPDSMDAAVASFWFSDTEEKAERLPSSERDAVFDQFFDRVDASDSGSPIVIALSAGSSRSSDRNEKNKDDADSWLSDELLEQVFG